MYTGLGECRIECFAIKRKMARVKAVAVEDARIFALGLAFLLLFLLQLFLFFRLFLLQLLSLLLDAAAPVAVFSPDPLVAAPPSRVPVLAAAEVFGAPALAVCGVDPEFAGASAPTETYRSVVQPVGL